MQVRQYRSHKQRPCDRCRLRKQRCLYDTRVNACVSCEARNVPCVMSDMKLERTREPVVKAEYGPGPRDDGHWPSEFDPDPSLLTMWDRSYPLIIGSSTDWDPFLVRHVDFKGTTDFSHAELNVRRINTDPEMPVQFQLSSSASYKPERAFEAVSAARKITLPFGERLIELFQETYQHAFPILNVRRLVNRFAATNNVPAALLLCVMCIAIEFWDSQNAAHKPSARELQLLLHSQLATETNSPRLPTVQALLLSLRMVSSGSGLPPDTWRQTCMMYAMCQDLGLNFDCTHWQIAEWEKRLRRRVWWMVYIHEKWTAMAVGRTSHIDDAECQVLPLCKEDFLESDGVYSTSEASIYFTIALADLTIILSQILKSFYTLAPRRDDDFERLLHGLSRWHDEHVDRVTNLGKPLGAVDPSPQLRIFYSVTEILLYRTVLRRPKGSIEPDAWKNTYSAGVSAVQSVAFEISHLPASQTDAFWPNYSKVCLAMCGTFIILLYLNSVTTSESEEALSRVKMFQRALQMKQKTMKIFTLAAQRINALLET